MDAAAKQQIVERVRQANNILVTVSANPSVDQLAACLGLTLLLNRMNKHATAVFSGAIPSVVEFLQPEKTIETNTDSLRDFIISLDKAKADKLRYKVEDQFVRIFITPYKTSLSEKDLIFSQGDFNVEVVVALGIKDRSHIDAAIAAHGRILHDATVITINAGQGTTDIGQINWQEPTASSLSEMLVSISEAFGTGLIDGQMATAFLTGIVAETQRFSNKKTSPKVMTMAAQLMAAGANQQLIATKLEPPKPVAPAPQRPVSMPPAPPKKPAPPPPIGVLNVPHGQSDAEKSEVNVGLNEIHIDEQGNLKTAGDLLAEQERKKEDEQREEQPPPSLDSTSAPKKPQENDATDDSMPGPHSFMDSKPTIGQAFTATAGSEEPDLYNTVPIDPLNEPQPSGLTDHLAVIQPPDEDQSSSGSPTRPDADNARGAVESALDSAPFDPAFAPPVESLNARQAMDLHTDEPQLNDTPPKTDDGRNGDTPSLRLPTNGRPATPPPNDDTQTGPPPMPPPLMPFSTPSR